jgi:hypothetical protein
LLSSFIVGVAFYRRPSALLLPYYYSPATW